MKHIAFNLDINKTQVVIRFKFYHNIEKVILKLRIFYTALLSHLEASSDVAFIIL